MENRSHALAAGIFTILLGICAAVAIWWLGQSDESTTSYVLETRRNVTGLNLQAQVRYRGIRAGKVTAIEPDEADPRVILVRINLSSRFKLTKGSTAQLGYQGVTGLAYVQIEDDGSSAEPLSGKDGESPRIALKPTLFDTLGENLRKLKLIYMDCGWSDQFRIHFGMRRFAKKLTAAGITHTYEEFDDDHTEVDYRMDIFIPLMAKTLSA